MYKKVFGWMDEVFVLMGGVFRWMGV